MEMKKISYFVGILLVGILMLGLVVGAGYNVVVPPAGTTSPGSSGPSGSSVVANATDNKTVSDDSSVDDGTDEGIGDAIGDGVDKVKDFVRNFGLKEIFILISGLAVIGASVWYFLRDRRKGYVEVKIKGSKKK